MFALKKLLKNIKFSIFSFHNLNVVSFKRTIFLVSLSLLVMLFDTISILSIMPLLKFLDSNQNIEVFEETTDYGESLVKFFYFLDIPFELLYLSTFVLTFFLIRQTINLFEVVETERTRLSIAK